ncbi:MAG: HEAT repeat domain-containing protein [Myxococcota bacterium]
MAGAQSLIALARSGEAGVQQVVDVLLAATSDDEARLAALALARSSAIGALALALRSGPLGVRQAAASALATCRGPDVIEVVLGGLDMESEPWLRRERARAGLSAGATALRLWQTKDVHARAVAVASLGEAGDSPEWIDRLAFALESESTELVWWAAATLRAHTGEVPASAFDALLEHKSAFVVAQAALALSARGLAPAADVPGLWQDDVPRSLDEVRSLDDADPADVARAALCLGLACQIDALIAAVGRLAASSLPVATQALSAGAAHPVPKIRAAAVKGLSGKSGALVWAAYEDRVRLDPDPRLRQQIIWSLGRRREPEAVDALVRWFGMDLGPKSAITEALCARVRKASSARSPEVRRVLEAVVASGGPSAELAKQGLSRFPA